MVTENFAIVRDNNHMEELASSKAERRFAKAVKFNMGTSRAASRLECIITSGRLTFFEIEAN